MSWVAEVAEARASGGMGWGGGHTDGHECHLFHVPRFLHQGLVSCLLLAQSVLFRVFLGGGGYGLFLWVSLVFVRVLSVMSLVFVIFWYF